MVYELSDIAHALKKSYLTIRSTNRTATNMKKKLLDAPKSYSCSRPLLEDIRTLNYKGQAQICQAWLEDNPDVEFLFSDRFTETFAEVDMDNLEETIENTHYALNDLDNAVTYIDYYSPTDFFVLERIFAKIIAEENKHEHQ